MEILDERIDSRLNLKVTKYRAWTVTIWNRNFGTPIQFNFCNKEDADAVAEIIEKAETGDGKEHMRIVVEESYDASIFEHLSPGDEGYTEPEKPKPKRKKPRPKDPSKAKDGYVCQECGDVFPESEVYEEPLYECDSDGPFTYGEADESNRCPVCNKFGSKIADIGCPNCQQGGLEPCKIYYDGTEWVLYEK